MKNIITRIFRYIGSYIFLYIKANLGVSGREALWDGWGVIWAIETTFFNCLVVFITGLAFRLEFGILLILCMITFLYSFLVVGFLLPSLADYLKLPFPIKGMSEEDAEKVFGRKMKIIE